MTSAYHRLNPTHDALPTEDRTSVARGDGLHDPVSNGKLNHAIALYDPFERKKHPDIFTQAKMDELYEKFGVRHWTRERGDCGAPGWVEDPMERVRR